MYDFYFNGKARKTEWNGKKSYIIERLDSTRLYSTRLRLEQRTTQEKKRKSFLCRLPRFADFYIIFSIPSCREFRLLLNLRTLVYKHFLFPQLLNFLNNILFFNYCRLSIYLYAMLYNMLSNLMIFPSHRFSFFNIKTIKGDSNIQRSPLPPTTFMIKALKL